MEKREERDKFVVGFGEIFWGGIGGKGEFGETGVLPFHSGVGLKLLEPKLLIKIDQSKLSYAIYVQLEKILYYLLQV